MKSKNLLTSLLLLGLTASAWAQTAPMETKPQAAQPLNLSLPRDLLHKTPPAAKADDTVTRNLRPESSSGRQAEHMPYGTGYEARQQGMRSGNSGMASGNSGMNPGNSGWGGGGRGGMGRRR
jgi:uncharacterized membrane protein YgcG